MRLTDISIRALTAPEQGAKIYADDTMPGFGVRVSQGGSKAFTLTMGESRERITIGRYPVISLAEARARPSGSWLSAPWASIAPSGSCSRRP